MVVLSGAVGALTLRFLENPLRYAPRLRRSPLGSIAVGGLATAMAACVGVAVLERIPNAVGHGARAIVLTNQKGAVLELSGYQTGLMANADLSGLAITLR